MPTTNNQQPTTKSRRPIRLKHYLKKHDPPISIRKFAELTAKAKNGGAVRSSKLGEIINGDSFTPEQMVVIRSAAKKNGINETDIFKKCTDDQLEQIDAFHRNGSKTPDEKVPGFKPVALNIFQMWGITTAQLGCELRYRPARLRNLLINGPNSGNQQMRDDIETWIKNTGYPIRTETLWDPKEINLNEERFLHEETIDRFEIKKPEAFDPNIPVKDVYRWKFYNDAEKRLTSEIVNQGTIAIIGPSGCGKSTLVNATIRKHFAADSKHAVKIMRPQCVDKEELKVSHILETICLDSGTKLKGGSNEEKSRYVLQALLNQREKDGDRAVIIIEEAHLLKENVIRTLKPLMELQTITGDKLLGIVLIAQMEMEKKMGPGTKQFWNRCKPMYFPSLVKNKEDKKPRLNHLHGYIIYRLAQAGLDHAKIFEGNSLTSVCKHIAQQGADYPLMVNNYLVRKLNEAAATAELGTVPSIKA